MEDSARGQTEKPLCIQSALRIIGDKWTGRILREMSGGVNTFSALETALETISPRTLSQRLDMLARQEIVVKQQYCEHPPRYQYVLTQKGAELQEVIQKMAEWGGRYCASGDKLDNNFSTTAVSQSDC